MRIKAKDPHLVSLMGEFMRIYLPGVRNRDKDTIRTKGDCPNDAVI